MRAAPLPDNERERLQALFRYGVLDTLAERSFDDLTRLASQICGVPIALVSLVDEHRQWFKSRVGLDVLETPRELAFCAHAILQNEVFEVPNALEDPRFADNPLVVGAPDIRFYAGAPLVTNDGFKLGTLCVIDRVPRRLNDAQLEALRILGRQVITQLELRHTSDTLARSLKDLQASRAGGSIIEEPTPERSESQRAFLAHVTHDLRTPLNAILGFAQLLREDAPLTDTERRELAGQIDAAGGYMLRLVNDILDVARLDSAAVTFAREAVPLEELVRAALETIRPLAQAAGNQIELVQRSSRRTIEGDATQIQKILFNLLSNACKYTHDGTIRVSLTDEDERWVRVDVVDSGIGMTPEQRMRLFRPFAQVHRGKLRGAAQSTGLGLYITRVLCERLGGAITVASEAGVGTTFTVWLPVDGAPPAPRGGAIAVAEGDPDVRAALQRSLGRHAGLVFFEEVAEVLWSLVDRRWRAVILDALAPGFDEIELVRAVERMCRDAETPVIVATTDDRPGPEGLPAWRVGDPSDALSRLLAG